MTTTYIACDLKTRNIDEKEVLIVGSNHREKGKKVFWMEVPLYVVRDASLNSFGVLVIVEREYEVPVHHWTQSI